MIAYQPARTKRMALLLAGCTTPIGADRVTTRQSYAQVEEDGLRTGKPTITQRLDFSGSHEYNARPQPEKPKIVAHLDQENTASGDGTPAGVALATKGHP